MEGRASGPGSLVVGGTQIQRFGRENPHSLVFKLKSELVHIVLNGLTAKLESEFVHTVASDLTTIQHIVFISMEVFI